MILGSDFNQNDFSSFNKARSTVYISLWSKSVFFRSLKITSPTNYCMCVDHQTLPEFFFLDYGYSIDRLTDA